MMKFLVGAVVAALILVWIGLIVARFIGGDKSPATV